MTAIPSPTLVIDGGVFAYLVASTTARDSDGALVPDAPSPLLRAREDLISLREQFGAGRMIMAWDGGGASARDKMIREYNARLAEGVAAHPAYKAARRARRDADPTACAMYERARELTEFLCVALPAWGVEQVIAPAGYEGDDALATIARDATRWPGQIVLCTSDHDLWPLLVDPRIAMFVPGDELPFRGEDLLKREGLTPTEAASVAAIAGCASDGVRGLKGIGMAKALRLVRACPGIVGLLAASTPVSDIMIRASIASFDPKAAKFAEQAIAGREIVELTERLTRLYDVELENDIAQNAQKGQKEDGN